MIFDILIQALYFFVPAYFGNVAPTLVKKIPFLNQAVDMGKTFRGKRIFGKNKTFRGLFFASLIGVLSFLLQRWLYQFAWFAKISLFDYTQMTIWLGFILGFGAIFGDLIESFLKRQIGIPSGKPWIPFDQLDFTVVALLLSSIIYLLEFKYIIALLLFTPILHLATHYTGYLLKINKEKI